MDAVSPDSQPGGQVPDRIASRIPVSPASAGFAEATRPGERGGLGWLILLPVACCAGPLVVGALAAAGAAAWGGLGAGVAVIGLVAVFVIRRRRAASCRTLNGSAPGLPADLRMTCAHDPEFKRVASAGCACDAAELGRSLK